MLSGGADPVLWLLLSSSWSSPSAVSFSRSAFGSIPVATNDPCFLLPDISWCVVDRQVIPVCACSDTEPKDRSERASAGQGESARTAKNKTPAKEEIRVRRDRTEDAQSRGRCERVYERTPTGADRGGAELPPMLPIRGGLRGTFLRKVLGAWRQYIYFWSPRRVASWSRDRDRSTSFEKPMIILEMARPSCMGVYQSNESMASQ